MHLPPDLSLASSYIPACLCLFKCTIAFILFIFSPVRGWIGLFSILITDRILWNQSANTTILDVNAVCVSLVGGLMVMHARSDGVKTLMHFSITGAWILLSSLQILGAARLHRAYEVLFAAFSVSALSCLFQAQERTELLALRSFVFVVANATLPYLGVMLQHSDIDTYINVCRTLLILLGEPEISSAWMAVYMLCIGWQVRNTNLPSNAVTRKNHTQRLVKYAADSEEYDDDEPAPPLQHAVVDVYTKHPAPSVQPQPSTPSEEAALLREALASRKGFRDA